jgi:hypothetical protein
LTPSALYDKAETSIDAFRRAMGMGKAYGPHFYRGKGFLKNAAKG